MVSCKCGSYIFSFESICSRCGSPNPEKKAKLQSTGQQKNVLMPAMAQKESPAQETVTSQRMSWILPSYNRIGSNLNASDAAMKRAMSILGIIMDRKLLIDLGFIDLTVAGAFYIACKECGCYRTKEEITKAASLERRHSLLLPARIDLLLRILKSSKANIIAVKPITKISNRGIQLDGKFRTSAYAELKDIGTKLNLDSAALQISANICFEALKLGLSTGGRTIREIAAASVYTACRLAEIPITMEDVVFASGQTLHGLWKNYSLIQRELNLTIPVPDPKKFIEQIANSMSLGEKIRQRALKILSDDKKAGKNPKAYAVTALYCACKLENKGITQQKFEDVTGVTTLTIRTISKELNEDLGL